nr:hypothetical protein CFP56_66089 [Quercus suber]POF06277.1 hypothetical protein CFP56_75741 [Quercus suber]
MDVDAPLGFGAPGDPNPPRPGSANPNLLEPATPIGLGASLPPLSPKQFEIVLVCPMPMEEDPSTVVLDDDE